MANEEVLDSKETFGDPKLETAHFETRYAGMRLPGLLSRVKAVFIDTLLVLSVFTATTLFNDTFGEIANSLKVFIVIFMFYLYDPLLTSFTGSTVGHKLMKLTVRNYFKPEKRISLTAALLRFLTKGLLGWLSFLTVTSNRRKRAIHDLASGSIVLKMK